MSQDYLYTIYINTRKCMIKYRKYSSKNAEVNRNDFMTDINRNTYYIDEYENDGNKIYTIITSKDSKITKASDPFQKQISSLVNKSENTTILYITNDSCPQNILKKYIQLRENGYSNLTVHFYKHSIFIMELPLHVESMPHKIMNKNEQDKLNSYYRTKPRDFPSIKYDDPQAIWIGANFNDLIEIDKLSETAGKNVTYRYVIE